MENVLRYAARNFYAEKTFDILDSEAKLNRLKGIAYAIARHMSKIPLRQFCESVVSKMSKRKLE